MAQLFYSKYHCVGGMEPLGGEIAIETSRSKTCEIDFIERSFSSQCTYYLKVIQENGEKAYSSPFWVKTVKRM